MILKSKNLQRKYMYVINIYRPAKSQLISKSLKAQISTYIF